jgi:dipicolinate synthase subunit B
MNWQGVSVGFALTGSHCTFEEVMPQIARFVSAGAKVFPIASYTLMSTDTRFGSSEHWQKQLKDITGNDIISTIVDAEPLGPSKLLDVLVIAPCTGNTTSKLANAMTENPVLMAAKAQMRNQRPLVLAISTNDGLGLNGQDAPMMKPNSLVARMDLIMETCESALQGKQFQPMIIERFNFS